MQMIKEKNSLGINKTNRKLNAIKSKNSGITLIALVVTIIILLILAVISINTVLNENGIIARAKKAQQLQKQAEEKEQMEFAKFNVAIDNNGNIPLEAYIENLIQENIVTRENVIYNENGSVQFVTKLNRRLMMEVNETRRYYSNHRVSARR